jgi:sodium-independent sulfate anion transporter 11
MSYSRAPREIAAVVPYRDGRLPDYTSSQLVSDIETGDVKVQIRDQETNAELRTWEPLLPQETPFFHLDLSSAVRAAESGLDRVVNFDHKPPQAEED